LVVTQAAAVEEVRDGVQIQVIDLVLLGTVTLGALPLSELLDMLLHQGILSGQTNLPIGIYCWSFV